MNNDIIKHYLTGVGIDSLEIDGVNFEFKISFASLKFLNEYYKITIQAKSEEKLNISMHTGLQFLLGELSSGSYEAVVLAIKAGTAHLQQKPSNEGIKNFLNEIYQEKMQNIDTVNFEDGIFSELIESFFTEFLKTVESGATTVQFLLNLREI